MRSPMPAPFGRAAALYDRARPGYPNEVFTDLISLGRLPPTGHVLEVGPGTGQATLPMAQRGYRMVAVELEEALASVLRAKAESFPNLQVEVANFETWPEPEGAFDLMMAATAFHWIDPSIGYARVARALRPGGAIALFRHEHVFGGDLDFFHAVQSCYESFMPGTPPGLRLQKPEDFPPGTNEINASGLFGEPVVRHHFFEETYSTDAYVELLSTYSNHITLDEGLRLSLFDCIRGLINQRFGGVIRKQYMVELIVARRS